MSLSSLCNLHTVFITAFHFLQHQLQSLCCNGPGGLVGGWGMAKQGLHHHGVFH